MTVEDIVREYLIAHKFDGLFNEEGPCGCALDDLIACGERCDTCEPGYKFIGCNEQTRSECESDCSAEAMLGRWCITKEKR